MKSAKILLMSPKAKFLLSTEPKRGKRKRKDMFADSSADVRTFISRRSPVLEVVQNCTMLEEIEIRNLQHREATRIDEEDLCYIAQCKLLRKLTLGGFHITDGVFLEEVRLF